MENAITQPAEGPQIFPRRRRKKKNIPLFPAYTPGSRALPPKLNQKYLGPSCFQFRVEWLQDALHSMINQSSLAVFQTEACSSWLALLAMRGQEQELPVQSLDTSGLLLYLSTDFILEGPLLSPGFLVSSIPYFLEKFKPQQSWWEAEHSKWHVPTCCSTVVLSPESFIQSSRTRGLCRKWYAIQLDSGHLILTVLSNED